MAKPDDIINEPDKNFEEVMDEFSGSGSLSTIEELEKMVNGMLAALPRLDRFKMRKEMEIMQVALKQNPTTSDLSTGLSNAQGYKDRLAEIYMMALREYKLRERCVDMLFDANNVISNGKSADVRRGQATMKYPMMLIQLEGADAFMKEVEHILQNVKSAMEAISRQVSVMQIQLQLGEVRRESPTNSSDAEEFRTTRSSGNAPKEIDW